MDDFTSIQYRRRLAQITGIDSLSENTIYESAKERERITDIINDINIDMKSLQPGDSLHAHLTKKKKELQKKLHSLKEEQIDEDFEVGRKVNVTNPKAIPRYEITGKDDTHYHLKGPDDKTMKLPKERIHRVNKVNEEQIDEAAINHVTAKIGWSPRHTEPGSAARARENHGARFGVTLTPRKDANDDFLNHVVSGSRGNVQNFLTHHYGGEKRARKEHPDVFSHTQGSAALFHKKDSLHTYYNNMTKYIKRGDDHADAHERATADVAREHGEEGLKHVPVFNTGMRR